MVLTVLYHSFKSCHEAVFLTSLTWMHNDLEGSYYICVRNLIIGVAYIVYGVGGLRVNLQSNFGTYDLTITAFKWTLIVGAVVSTTI